MDRASAVRKTLPSLQMSWYVAFLGSPEERKLVGLGIAVPTHSQRV